MNKKEQEILDLIELQSKLRGNSIKEYNCWNCIYRNTSCKNASYERYIVDIGNIVINYKIYKSILSYFNFCCIVDNIKQGFSHRYKSIPQSLTVCKNITFSERNSNSMSKIYNIRILDLKTHKEYKTYDEIMDLYKKLKNKKKENT